jgi:hypothetical protein
MIVVALGPEADRIRVAALMNTIRGRKGKPITDGSENQQYVDRTGNNFPDTKWKYDNPLGTRRTHNSHIGTVESTTSIKNTSCTTTKQENGWEDMNHKPLRVQQFCIYQSRFNTDILQPVGSEISWKTRNIQGPSEIQVSCS